MPECFQLPDSGNRYVLKGIIHKSGSMTGGHYTAHIKRVNEWFFANDGSMSRENIEKLRDPVYDPTRNRFSSSHGTMFYYEKVK